jgi:peptidoglycan DL-endopeptidase CwlO
MSDFATMLWRGSGRKTLRGILAVVAVTPLVGVAGQAFAGTPSRGLPTAKVAPAATTTTLPPIPKVPLSLTDGQNPKNLLANAIELSSVGIDTSALATAIEATQAKMDADSIAAHKAQTEASAADSQAAAALGSANGASAQLQAMNGAVRNAAVLLYTEGPAPLTVNPNAGQTLAYAADYADSALSPYGVLAQRQSTATQMQAALQRADSARKAADRASARATRALDAETAEASRLQSMLSSISRASASAVEADHTALAGQAGKELLSESTLQFDPKARIPAPVATTPVALTWAFAELGRKYVWGATGPKTFDCSGLTQFVWHAAGVNIPRVAAAQDSWTIPVPLSALLPGDLVFYGRTDIHHVGIYIGDGLMINAPHTGTVVQVSSIWWSDLAGFGRIHSAGVPVPAHQPPSASKPAEPIVVPTAGPVPSQPKPPKGWKPAPGSTSPVSTGGSTGGSGASTTTTSTVPPTTTYLPVVPTTAPVDPTTSTTTGSG